MKTYFFIKFLGHTTVPAAARGWKSLPYTEEAEPCRQEGLVSRTRNKLTLGAPALLRLVAGENSTEIW